MDPSHAADQLITQKRCVSIAHSGDNDNDDDYNDASASPPSPGSLSPAGLVKSKSLVPADQGGYYSRRDEAEGAAETAADAQRTCVRIIEGSRGRCCEEYPAATSPCRCPHGTLYLEALPNEVLLHVLGFLDVSDLLSMSRVGLTVSSRVPFAPVFSSLICSYGPP